MILTNSKRSECHVEFSPNGTFSWSDKGLASYTIYLARFYIDRDRECSKTLLIPDRYCIGLNFDSLRDCQHEANTLGVRTAIDTTTYLGISRWSVRHTGAWTITKEKPMCYMEEKTVTRSFLTLKTHAIVPRFNNCKTKDILISAVLYGHRYERRPGSFSMDLHRKTYTFTVRLERHFKLMVKMACPLYTTLEVQIDSIQTTPRRVAMQTTSFNVICSIGSSRWWAPVTVRWNSMVPERQPSVSLGNFTLGSLRRQQK